MSTDIGIDFGTRKTIILGSGGILLEEPSVVTVDTVTWKPLHFGNEAASMVGRTPESLTTVFPIERGVIADLDIAEQMLKNYIKRAFGNRIIKPRVIASVPIGVTSVQHRSMANAIETAGGRNVMTIEGPMAAAIGVGVDFSKAKGSMIIDIGAGTTDVATIALGGLAECESAKVASGDFDEAIIKHIRKEHNILVGLQTAENIKKQIGSVMQRPIQLVMQAKGRNLFSGLPQIFEITSDDVYNAIAETAMLICQTAKIVLERTSPDLVVDIMNDGVNLTGAGAQIFGMDELLSNYIGAKVTLANDPAHTVARGAGIALKRPELLQNGDYQFRSIKELIIE